MLALVASVVAFPHNQARRSLVSAGDDDVEAISHAQPGAVHKTQLTQVENDLFIAEIVTTLHEIQACAPHTEFINITTIKNVQYRVESGKEDGYILECCFKRRGTTTPNHELEATVELITFESPAQFEISKIEPYHFFPKCTRDLIEEEIAAGLNATAASTKSEAAIEAAQAMDDLPHLQIDGLTTRKRLQKALRAQQATAADFAAGGRLERHALGYKREKAQGATFDRKPRDAMKLLRSMPDEYHPFADNATMACLHTFPARDQGTCGSCYAFASSTAASLSYCLAAAKKGITFKETPVLSAQPLVSCGSRMPVESGVIKVKINTDDTTGMAHFGSENYNWGCDGGSGVASFKYQMDVGFPYTSCYPYASGGGNPLHHFDAAAGELPECHDTCTGQFTHGKEMEAYSGLVAESEDTAAIEMCTGEAAIMECMTRLGPMFCGMDVWSDFSDHDTSKIYDGPHHSDEHDEQPYLRGGHAVVCFGWGVDVATGVKYWKCINSWGSWGEFHRGEFYIRKGNDTAMMESYGCSAGVIDEAQVTGLPPFTPPPPPAPAPPPSPPPLPPFLPHTAPAPPPSPTVVHIFLGPNCTGAMKTVSRADLRGVVKAEPDSHDNGYDACGSGDAATASTWNNGEAMAYNATTHTWWGSYRVAAGYAVDAGGRCRDDFEYEGATHEEAVSAAAGCVTPEYDFNFVAEGWTKDGEGHPDLEPLTHADILGAAWAEAGAGIGAGRLEGPARAIGEAIGAAMNATMGPIAPEDEVNGIAQRAEARYAGPRR